MAKQLRLGFMGCGGMARAHLEGLKERADVEIAAFTDVSREAAQTLADAHGGKVFHTPGELAAEAGVDAVYILLPPFAHGDAERAALAHKIPFFVEKPVGLDMGLSWELAAEVERLGLLTAAGYMNRYQKSVNAAREALKADGGPILAYGGWIGGSPGDRADSGIRSWWTDKDKSGGQFVEQVTHTVDVARYLFGDAVEVFAHAANGFNRGIAGYSIDDASSVNILFKNGGVANLMGSVSSNAEGALFLTVHALNCTCRFTGWEHSVAIKRKGVESAEQVPGESKIFPVEDAAFLEAVRTGDRSLVYSSYPDAVKTLEISVAANESMLSHRAVALRR